MQYHLENKDYSEICYCNHVSNHILVYVKTGCNYSTGIFLHFKLACMYMILILWYDNHAI